MDISNYSVVSTLPSCAAIRSQPISDGHPDDEQQQCRLGCTQNSTTRRIGYSDQTRWRDPPSRRTSGRDVSFARHRSVSGAKPPPFAGLDLRPLIFAAIYSNASGIASAAAGWAARSRLGMPGLSTLGSASRVLRRRKRHKAQAYRCLQICWCRGCTSTTGSPRDPAS